MLCFGFVLLYVFLFTIIGHALELPENYVNKISSFIKLPWDHVSWK